MKILQFPQRSPEWFQARLGMPTSSEFSNIITSQGKQSASRKKYMYKLAGEKLGGTIEEGYQSVAMLKGIEKEEEAKRLYNLIREPIQEVGFCLSDCGRYGSSTDGLLNDKGVFELKCPTMGVHIQYLIEKEIPTEYFQQTQGELFVTKREYIEFMSYYPGLKPLIVREQPNEVFQRILNKELEIFCEELDKLVKDLS